MDPEVSKVPGELPLERMGECRDYHKKNVGHSKKEATRLGTTVFFSEFGACGENESCYEEIKNSCDAFDEYGVSWTYWMLKGFGDHTTHSGIVEGIYNDAAELQKGKVRVLSRTYF